MPHPRRILVSPQLALEPRDLFSHIENLELQPCVYLLMPLERGRWGQLLAGQ